MMNTYNPGSRFSQSSPYGVRIDPFTGNSTPHAGQDFKAPAGTPIPAAASGKVVYSGFNEGLGNVVIVKNDAGGYSLYGHMQHGDQIEHGRRIWQGDTVGLVGSTGARTTGDHLHYSVITDEAGDKIARTNKGGSIGVSLDQTTTKNPAQYDNYDPTPRYLDATRRAAKIMLGPDASTASGGRASESQTSFGDRFESFPPVGIATAPNLPGDESQGILSNAPVRTLGRRVISQSGASVSEATVPAVPFVPPNEVLASDDRASFGDRFGNWNSSDGGITPRNPNLPMSAPEPDTSLRILSGKPTPRWVTLPISSLPENSDASSSGNWFSSLADALENAKKSQAPAIDAGGATAPFVPPDNPSMGGLAGGISAAAGIDPQNPIQFAPPSRDDGLSGFYRDDTVQPWLLRGLVAQR